MGNAAIGNRCFNGILNATGLFLGIREKIIVSIRFWAANPRSENTNMSAPNYERPRIKFVYKSFHLVLEFQSPS